MDDNNKKDTREGQEQELDRNYLGAVEDGMEMTHGFLSKEELDQAIREIEDPNFQPELDPRTQSLIELIDREQRKRGIIPKSEREGMNTKK